MKMMYKALLSLLVAASAASAASEFGLNKQLREKQDSLESKRGLTIDGSITGVLVNSYFNSDLDKFTVAPNAKKPENNDVSTERAPNVERSNFVTADIGFHFRPYETVRANMILRLEAGMQNYFASSAKSISAEWINLEGNVSPDFYWVIGDFRQQYSPLTLFAPTGVDEILYEPLIFARAKELARQNALIDGNQRNLQGVNLQFRHDFGGAAGEVRAEGLFARVRRVQLLDVSGANGNLLTGGDVPGAYQSANMDKWLLSGNVEYLPMNKNVLLGFTGMYVFDDSSSFRYTSRPKTKFVATKDTIWALEEDPATGVVDSTVVNKTGGSYEFSAKDYQEEYINEYDLDAQQTTIMAGRLGVDVAGLLENKNLTLDVMGEFAMSSDKLYTYEMRDSVNDTTGIVVVDPNGLPIQTPTRVDVNDDGKALLVTFNAGYKFSFGLDAQLSVNYIKNDSNWYNNMAQSPEFFATRILNVDKDGQTSRYGVNSPLYSSFGALYYFDPKFTPMVASNKNSNSGMIGSTDDPIWAGQTASYNLAPMNLNSWRNKVYNRKEIALMNSMMDPALQMSLPNGLATANRNGIQADMTISYNDFVEVKGLFSSLKQEKSDNPYLKEAEYTEFGFGGKIDIFKAVGFSLPFEISGSYKKSTRKQELSSDWVKSLLQDAWTPESDLIWNSVFTHDKGELNLDFINVGFYTQYLPRLGLSAGFQMINMEMDMLSSGYSFMDLDANYSVATSVRAPGYETPLVKGKQMQWKVGLDYTIEKGVYLALNYGWIIVENTYNTSMGQLGSNVPMYVSTDDITVKENNVPVVDPVSGKQVYESEFKHKFSQAVVEAVLNVNF